MKTYTFVLIHGSWHTGDLMEGVAKYLREDGHSVYTPTQVGAGKDHDKRANLTDAINGLVDFFAENKITDAVMYGHSWGGVPMTGTYDRLPDGTVKRLIWHSAFVPNDGQRHMDLIPQSYQGLFEQLREADGGIGLPYPVWRDALMNDADEELAASTYKLLDRQPFNAVNEPIKLSRNPAEFPCGKSYIIGQSDWTMPISMGGYYSQAEKIGLYRHVEVPGGHEVCFTNPKRLAEAIYLAGRD
jgi:pimeloyl-ACP methyl ester carboxylesterase